MSTIIVLQQEKIEPSSIQIGMKLSKIQNEGSTIKSEPYYVVSVENLKYGEVLVRAASNLKDLRQKKSTHEFRFPNYSTDYMFEDLSIEAIVDPDSNTDIDSNSILSDSKSKFKEDEWTEEEVKAAKARIMEKSQKMSDASDEVIGGIFSKKQKVTQTELPVENMSEESQNGDLFSVSKNVEEKPQEDAAPQKVVDEDWGEISDYKTAFNGVETLVRVIHCDSLKSKKFGLKSLPSKAFDCSIVDPPYGMAFRSNTRKKENRHMKIENDDNVDFIPDFLRELNRVTKDDSFIYIFFSHHFIDYLISEVKKVFKDGYKGILVWEKNNTTAGDLDVWGSQTEFIVFIKKGNKSLTEVRDGNVFKFNKIISDNHPTEKPLDLIQYLLHNSCKPGEMVLDCFAGSGVLAEAALYERINCVVMEYEQKYYDYICYRVSDSIKRPKLLMDAFGEGIDNRTDKYIKVLEASYEQKFQDAIFEQEIRRREKLIELIGYELKNKNYGTVPFILNLLENS